MAASYPAAVKTFTSRNAGDTIQPAHVNDLQDEVNAIEAGLLNGTAPLTSSNTIVNTLQVSSNSTFAIRPVMPPPSMALVFMDSTVALGSSAASTLSWTAESYVSNSSMHSTTTNPDRLTPQTTGVYQFTAQAAFSGGSSGARQIAVVDSSGTALAITRATAFGSEAITAATAGYKRFDVLGGYCVVTISVGTSTCSLSSGVGQTWFSMVKL